MLILTPLDLQETRLRMEGLSKITTTRGADKSNTIQTQMCRNEVKIHEKSASELNKKRCLKIELKKQKKSQKLTPKWLQKSDFISRDLPLVELWWSKPFL